MPFELFRILSFFVCVVNILNEPWKISQQITRWRKRLKFYIFENFHFTYRFKLVNTEQFQDAQQREINLNFTFRFGIAFIEYIPNLNLYLPKQITLNIWYTQTRNLKFRKFSKKMFY